MECIYSRTDGSRYLKIGETEIRDEELDNLLFILQKAKEIDDICIIPEDSVFFIKEEI